MRNDSITEVVGRLSESGTVSDKELESFKINKDESILASCICFVCQDWILKSGGFYESKKNFKSW